VLSNVLLVVREIGTEKIMTRSAQIGLAAALLLLGNVCDGPKWSPHWRIPSSAVEPESLWPVRLLPSLLRLLSALPGCGWLLGLLPHFLSGAGQ
jgi:hypothetical protein